MGIQAVGYADSATWNLNPSQAPAWDTLQDWTAKEFPMGPADYRDIVFQNTTNVRFRRTPRVNGFIFHLSLHESLLRHRQSRIDTSH